MQYALYSPDHRMHAHLQHMHMYCPFSTWFKSFNSDGEGGSSNSSKRWMKVWIGFQIFCLSSYHQTITIPRLHFYCDFYHFHDIASKRCWRGNLAWKIHWESGWNWWKEQWMDGMVERDVGSLCVDGSFFLSHLSFHSLLLLSHFFDGKNNSSSAEEEKDPEFLK